MLLVFAYSRYTKKVLFTFLVLLFGNFSSQIPGLINYNQSNGLTSSYTYNLRQDKNGFIWIGSSNGLYRFDGINFNHYGKKNGLKNIDIIDCEPMGNGEIFIIPFLEDFAYLKGNTVINSDLNPELKKIRCGTAIPQINYNKSKDEVIIYSNSNPKNIYIYKSGRVKEIPIDINYDKNSPFYAIDFKPETQILYLRDAHNNIFAYNLTSRKIRLCYSKINASESFYYIQNDQFLTHDKKRIISIYRLENKYSLKKIYSYHSPENTYSGIIDKNLNLWVALEEGGVLYFDNPLSPSSGFPKQPVKFLEEYIINYVLTDHDNNIWFATRNNGLFFIGEAPFRRYLTLPLKNNSSYITSAAANSKNIFLGYNITSGGVYGSGRLTNLIFTKDKKIENKAIYANEKFVYFGQTDDIFAYNILTKKTISLNIHRNIKNLIPYGNNDMLICTSSGLEQYNLNSHTRKKIWDQRTYTALPYTKDSMFAGTFKDLYQLNIATKKSKLFLEGYYFTDIKKLRDHVYAGSSSTKGILIFNSKKIIRKIDETQGLNDVLIKKITVENENIIWASTENGLTRIDLTNDKPVINNFTITDGLPSEKISDVIIKGDSLFAGTSKGLGILSIKRLLSQQKYINKKVIINSVMIGEKEYFNSYGHLISQTPRNNVVFNLSFLDYASQGKIGYQYKLEGLNTNWETTNSSRIIFSSLPPKKYIFKVYGLGYNGKRSSTYTELPFEIKPKFWQTTGFRTAFIILTAIMLMIIVKVFFQKRRDQQLQEILTQKKFAELELQAIKAQINPHFIYNCLNSIKFLLYKKENADAENYLKAFSKIMRKTLHYSEKTFMPICEEIEYLTLYLTMEKLRLKKQFDYTITLSEKMNPDWLIPSLLIQPFVENAIKHGISSLKDRKGIIKIDFEYTQENICVTIEDNGIGIKDKSVLTKNLDSFGIKLSQKRVETFKQLFDTKITWEVNDLSETQLISGTQVKLFISQNENQNTSMHH